MPREMVTVAPIIIQMPEDIDEAALERANEAMAALLDAANSAHPDIELLTPNDPRYEAALISGAMAHIEAANPESAETAHRALEALGLLQGGEERMN